MDRSRRSAAVLWRRRSSWFWLEFIRIEKRNGAGMLPFRLLRRARGLSRLVTDIRRSLWSRASALGLAGAEAMVGPFWAMATSRMAGLSAAAGIAVINSLANLGGYFGPDIIGLFRTSNGGFRGGLLAIAATVSLSGIAAVIVGRVSTVSRGKAQVENPRQGFKAKA